MPTARPMIASSDKPEPKIERFRAGPAIEGFFD